MTPDEPPGETPPDPLPDGQEVALPRKPPTGYVTLVAVAKTVVEADKLVEFTIPAGSEYSSPRPTAE